MDSKGDDSASVKSSGSSRVLGGLTKGLDALKGFVARGQRSAPQETEQVRETRQALLDAAIVGDTDSAAQIIRDAGDASFPVELALQEVVRRKDFLALACLVEAGADIDHADYDELTVLDYCFQAFDDSSEEELLEMMGYVIMRMDSNQALELIETYASSKDFDPQQLQALVRCLVSGSAFPIITTLQAAEFFNTMAEKVVIFEEDYKAMSSSFTETAKELFNNIRSDYVAAILLKEEDLLGNSILSVAIEARNIVFMGDGRVTRILNTMWCKPHFMVQNKFTSDLPSYNSVVQLLVTSPRDFFMLPVGKFIVETVAFMIFLVLYSVFLEKRISVDDGVSYVEMLMWAFVFAFAVNELSEMAETGIVSHYADSWNLLDLGIYVNFTCIGAMRILASLVLSHPGDSNELNSNFAEVIFRICVSLNAILLYVRILFFFSIHPTVGPLLRMMDRMIGDVKNFAIVMILFGFGFALSFRFLVGDASDNYGTLSVTILTLYQAMLGNFDFSAYDALADITTVVAQALLALFLVIAQIMLLNMLIAMMSESYADVQGQAGLEYNFGRAVMISRYDETNNELPPPLNIIVYFGFVLRKVFGVCCCPTSRDAPEDAEMKEQNIGKWYREFEERRASGVEHPNLLPPDHTDFEAYWCGYCKNRNPAMDMNDNRAVIADLIKRMDAQPGADLAAKSRTGSTVDGSVPAAREHKSQPSARSSRIHSDRVPPFEGEYVGEELIAATTRICTHCGRTEKNVGDNENMRENISYLIFCVVVAPLLLVFLGIPLGVVIVAEHLVKTVESRKQREESERIREKVEQLKRTRLSQTAEERARNAVLRKAKSDWVRRYFKEEELSLSAVHEGIHDLREKLDVVHKIVSRKQGQGDLNEE